MSDGGPDHWRRLERLYVEAPVNAYYEPTIEVGQGTARITMPAKETSFHGAGSLHGSVYFKLLDDAAGFAVFSVEPEVLVVTASFTVYILAPVSGGTLEAVGTVGPRSGRQFVAQAEVLSDGKVVAHGSGLFTRTKVPLASLPGYG